MSTNQFCNQCGVALPNQARFCSSCGSAIAGGSPSCEAQAGSIQNPQASRNTTVVVRAVNNNVIWALAFAPIIGWVLSYMMAAALYGNKFLAAHAISTGKLILVPIALNIGLLLLDLRLLKKAGVDTEKFSIWMFILIPVYIYKRAKLLNHSLAYFCAWIACFIISFFL